MATRSLPILLVLSLLILTSCGSFKEKQQLIRIAQSGKRLAVACESYWTTIQSLYATEERGLQTKQALYVWLTDESNTGDVPGQCDLILSALNLSPPDLQAACQLSRELTAALSDTLRVLKSLPSTRADEPAINIRSAAAAFDSAVGVLETGLSGLSDHAKADAADNLETAALGLKSAIAAVGPAAQDDIKKGLSTRRNYVAAIAQRTAICQEIEGMFGEYEEFLNVDVKERAEAATKPLISTLTAVNPIPGLSTELLSSLVQSLARMQLNKIKRKSALAAASELTEFSILFATVFEWERYMVWDEALRQISAADLLFLDYSLSGLELYTGVESGELISIGSRQGFGSAGLYRDVGILSRLGFLNAGAKHESVAEEMQKTGVGLSWKLGLFALDVAALAHQEMPGLIGRITFSDTTGAKSQLQNLNLKIEPGEIPVDLEAKLDQSPTRYPIIRALFVSDGEEPAIESPEEIAKLLNRQLARRSNIEGETLRKSLLEREQEILESFGASKSEQNKKTFTTQAITTSKNLSGLPYMQLLSLALHLELATI